GKAAAGRGRLGATGEETPWLSSLRAKRSNPVLVPGLPRRPATRNDAKKGPPVRAALLIIQLRRADDLVSRVVDGVRGVLDCVARSVHLVAGGVERRVGGIRRIGRRGVDVGLRIVLDRSLIRRVVGGLVLVARGKSEREDRNGHNGNLLHDRSTPILSAPAGHRSRPWRVASGQTAANSGNPYCHTRDYSCSWN